MILRLQTLVSSLLAVAVLTVATPAFAQRWVSTRSELAYTVVHPFHEVVGKSTKAEAIAVLDASGAKVMVRVPVSSFDSSNSNRDAHVLEVVEAAKHPLVVLRGAIPGFTAPAVGASKQVTMDAELEFHGVKKPVKVLLTFTTISDAQWKVAAKLNTSLEAHGVERPSLMFVAVEDNMKVEATVTLEPKS